MRVGVSGCAHVPLCLAPLSTSLQAEDPPLREGPHSSGGPAAAQAGEGAGRDVPARQAGGRGLGLGEVSAAQLEQVPSQFQPVSTMCVCACVWEVMGGADELSMSCQTQKGSVP